MFGFIFDALKAVSGIGDTINGITAAIRDAKVAAINAKTAEEKIAAEERVKTLEARRDVMIAEAGVSKANVYVRTFIALPIGVLFWKIFVWDKALGQWTQGRTDALSQELWQVITAVLGFYFVYEAVTGVTKIIKQR